MGQVTVTTTICDHCGADLTAEDLSQFEPRQLGGIGLYRLVVTCERRNSGQAGLHDLANKPIAGTVYFCGLPCLVAWAAKRLDLPELARVAEISELNIAGWAPDLAY